MGEHPDKIYLELAEKWLNGTISPEEEEIFAKWYNQNQDAIVHLSSSIARDEEELGKIIFKKIEAKKREPKIVPLYRFSMFKIAAAVVFIIISTATYFALRQDKPAGIISSSSPTKRINIIKPGGNRATLKLANGAEIVLDDANNGNIASQGNAKVIKLNNGQLVYKSAALKGEQYTPPLNTLTTPMGGQYQITLSDGTLVWLNANTSITFPTVFTGKDRELELQGEAYFEVAKNPAKPFKVKVRNMEVTVLGTHFNIMSYSDEPTIKTTLLEGAVQVTAANKTAALIPGQQSQLNDKGNFTITDDIDVNETIAWKNGMFYFEGKDIKYVMRELARWYNLNVEYQGEVNKHFSGKILRNAEASKVFKMLELTGEVHFKIQSNKVIVSP